MPQDSSVYYSSIAHIFSGPNDTQGPPPLARLNQVNGTLMDTVPGSTGASTSTCVAECDVGSSHQAIGAGSVETYTVSLVNRAAATTEGPTSLGAVNYPRDESVALGEWAFGAANEGKVRICSAEPVVQLCIADDVCPNVPALLRRRVSFKRNERSKFESELHCVRGVVEYLVFILLQIQHISPEVEFVTLLPTSFSFQKGASARNGHGGLQASKIPMIAHPNEHRSRHLTWGSLEAVCQPGASLRPITLFFFFSGLTEQEDSVNSMGLINSEGLGALFSAQEARIEVESSAFWNVVAGC
ncbi:hypothetical protein PTI98_007505 [Pleurotus ostreatus]|nr:hypothetical protein PTI98_007505 [Pleurotus ostreatus]